MDIERQRALGRIGGLVASGRNDPRDLTRPARDAFRRRFENLADPRQELEPAERERRARRLLDAHMLQLALRSADARRARSSRPPEAA